MCADWNIFWSALASIVPIIVAVAALFITRWRNAIYIRRMRLMDKRNEYELMMNFNFKNNSLYELGNVLVDINHVLTFCELIDEGHVSYAIRTYSDSNFRNQDSKFLDISNKFRIEHISKGSIEIVVAGMSFLGAVILMLLARYVQKSDEKRNEMIRFDIRCNERDIDFAKAIIDKYARFGLDGANINDLMKALQNYRYDVRSDSYRSDTYIITEAEADKISNILMSYADRIVFTVYLAPKHKR